MSLSFRPVPLGEPHSVRAKAILRSHPEVRALIGRNPWTALVLTLVVTLQVGIAWIMGVLGGGYWWLALLIAYSVGAFANHCLYVVVHEATHNLIFRRRLFNRLAAIACDLTNVVPGAIGFSIYHLQHHSNLNLHEIDPDVASEWEARLVGNRWYMKAVWLLFFPLFQTVRVMIRAPEFLLNRWVVLNSVIVIAFDILVVLLLGWNALLYLFASMLFSVGLHPLGARWIQEHYSAEADQPTFSYYGPLNWVCLNMGYHNEHHDFPSVPWSRLPALRAMAPEFYEAIRFRPSWTGLLLTFIFDKRFSLYSRLVRTEPVRANEPVRAGA